MARIDDLRAMTRAELEAERERIFGVRETYRDPYHAERSARERRRMEGELQAHAADYEIVAQVVREKEG